MWLLHQQKSKAISFIYTYYVVMWQWHQQIHKGPLINCIHICYVAVASTV